MCLVTVTLKLDLTDQETLLSPPCCWRGKGAGVSHPSPQPSTKIWERLEQYLHRDYVIRGLMQTLPYLNVNYSKSEISEFTIWTTAWIFREKKATVQTRFIYFSICLCVCSRTPVLGNTCIQAMLLYHMAASFLRNTRVWQPAFESVCRVLMDWNQIGSRILVT
jgi:hypothetical protein